MNDEQIKEVQTQYYHPDIPHHCNWSQFMHDAEQGEPIGFLTTSLHRVLQKTDIQRSNGTYSLQINRQASL